MPNPKTMLLTSNSPEEQMMFRRELSSDSTISASSFSHFPNTCSSKQPTSSSESISELITLDMGNILTVQSLECFNTVSSDDLSTLNSRTKSISSTCTHNKLFKDHVVQDLRECNRNELLENANKNFEYIYKNEKTPRRSARLTNSSESIIFQKKSDHFIHEAQDKGIDFSMVQSQKPEFEERRSTRYLNKLFKHAGNSKILEKCNIKKTENKLCVSVPLSRELKNLTDTLEYAKIDIVPIIHEIWSNGKLVNGDYPRKKNQLKKDESTLEAFDEHIASFRTELMGKRRKLWLNKGLYAGQDDCSDWYEFSLNNIKRKTRSHSSKKPNKALPLPMWHGKRLIEMGRDFKLPFDVCSPLPPGQPKPDEWRKTTKNRFVGEAGALWKVSKFLYSSSSKCVCNPELGCDDNCQNRIMFYECDDSNCASGPSRCTNRPFAALQERRKAGGKYRVGVEVIKTIDRGYGVRSTRCFEPNQIIVEYTGEIITEEECDRRMREDYKNNDCHYLMSFDQSMIIDATKGSIARFVNHSCKPNCRMVKWIIGGYPRLALFAGDEPIMTGDELTYDYNFDPFSTKNIQKCRCGNDNCRGVLGPRPKDLKLAKEMEQPKIAVKGVMASSKRKLKESSGDYAELESPISKKRKTEVGAFSGVSCSSFSKKNVKSNDEDIPQKILRKGCLNNSGCIIKKTKRSNSLDFRTSRNQKNSFFEHDTNSVTTQLDTPTRCLRSLKSRKMPSNQENDKTRSLMTNIPASKRKRKSQC